MLVRGQRRGRGNFGLNPLENVSLDSGTIAGQSEPFTVSRSAGGVYVMDNEGLLRFARDNEQPFVNLRRVENVLARMSVTSSQDLTTAGWIKGGSCTVTRDATVLTDDGLSSNLITFTDNTSAAAITTASITSETAAKRSWFTAFRIKAGTVASIQVGFLDGAGSLLTQQQCTLTSSWTTFGEILSQYAGANGNVKLRLRADGAGTLYIDYGQMEEITGASVQVFGGRVGVDTQYGAGIAAVKYFATTNGNTYNSSTGVVTEAAGTALTSGAALIEAQGTNLVAAPNYRNISTWTSTGVTMKATTPTGIDGTTLTVSQNEIMEDTGTTEHRKDITWTAATAAKQSVMVAVRRGAGTRHAEVSIGNATDGIYGRVAYNLDTLATIGTVTADYTTAYVKGAYVVIELIDTNTTTGTQTLYVNIHNGTSNSYTGDGASSLIVDWATVVTSWISQSPVVGAATRYGTYPQKNWIGAANNFWFFVDFDFLYSDSAFVTGESRWAASVYKDANNNAMMRFINSGSGLLRIQMGNNGVFQETDITNFSIDRGDRCRAVVSYDEVNGFRCRARNGTGAAATSLIATFKNPIVAFNAGTKIYLGSKDGVDTAIGSGGYRNLKYGTGILTVAQQIELVGA